MMLVAALAFAPAVMIWLTIWTTTLRLVRVTNNSQLNLRID
jgi:hypothetical protein